MYNKRKIFKYKFCRLIGNDLWGYYFKKLKKTKIKKYLNQINIDKREYFINKVAPKLFTYNLDPNQKPEKIFKRRSLYFKNLINLQKFKKYYSNITTKQIRKNINIILKKKYNLLNNFAIYFEMRLDSILFRSHFAYSFMNARQLIKHGFVLVNKMRVTNISIILKPGDIIEIIDLKKLNIYQKLQSRKYMNKYLIDLNNKIYKKIIKKKDRNNKNKIINIINNRIKPINQLIIKKENIINKIKKTKIILKKYRETLFILTGLPEYLDVDYSLMSCFIISNVLYKNIPYSENLINNLNISYLLNKFVLF